MKAIRLNVLGGLLVGGTLACATAYAQTAQRPSTSPSSEAPARAATIEQSQALGLLSVINQAEINAGQLAASRAAGADTKRYGQFMVKEHTDNQAKLNKWPADTSSPLAQAKAEEAKAEAAALGALRGADFDAAYLKAMVMDHRKALAALDGTLIPAAEDPAVEAFLKETRTHVAAHLKQAEMLQGKAQNAPTDRAQGR